MSTSELFTLRNKLLKNSFSEFKKLVLAQKIPLDHSLLTNLLLLVYENESLRKNLFQYLSFFAQYSKDIVHAQVVDRRRLLQDLCFCARADDIRQLSIIIINIQAGLQDYHLPKLITLCLDGKSNMDSAVATIGELLAFRKYLANGGQLMSNESNMLVLYALKKDAFWAALELLKNNIGFLGKESQELFALSDCKINKRDTENLCKFVQIYLEKSRCNPRLTDRKGRTFLQYLSKQHQKNVQEVIKEFQRTLDKVEKHVRRSENKVRSSVGPGQNVKQYSNEPLHVSSKQELKFNIQNMGDQISVQRQAGRLYQRHINQKQKYFRYQKNQMKLPVPAQRVGIIKSDELRYYLEEDILYEVTKLKEENKRCRPYYIEIIHKLKQKLCAPLLIDLQVFGSVETALCLPESDIDIIILPNKPNQQIYPFQLLENIQELLEEMHEQIFSVKLIKSATVPIIKVVSKRIDITYRDDNHNGRQAVKLVCSYKEEYPQLQSLIFVLKKFIYASNLSQPYLGGLSSYGLILMIVAYIQQEYRIHQIQKKQEPIMIADLLIGFLKFYGFKMNYIMKSIEVCDKNESQWQRYSGCLSRYTDPTNPIIDLQPKLVIIDPLNKQNNIGRSTHKIKHIQMAFQIAYISIHTFKECGRKRRCESFRRIAKCPRDVRYADYQRPCCILKRMFACTEKFIKQ